MDPGHLKDSLSNNENKKQNYLLFSQDEFEWKNISNNKLKQDLFPELEIKHNGRNKFY